MLKDFCVRDRILASDFAGNTYAEPVIPFIAAKAREFAEVVFICDSHDEDDIEFNRFPRHCVRGTVGAEIIDELKGITGTIITKQRYSGFFNTDLAAFINDFAEIHVVGVCTNICVQYTVEELCNRDKKVVVYRDGVASFDPEAHEFALKQMEQVLGAEIR
jgi:nicotinamidase/pyrazinamidase